MCSSALQASATNTQRNPPRSDQDCAQPARSATGPRCCACDAGQVQGTGPDVLGQALLCRRRGMALAKVDLASTALADRIASVHLSLNWLPSVFFSTLLFNCSTDLATTPPQPSMTASDRTVGLHCLGELVTEQAGRILIPSRSRANLFTDHPVDMVLGHRIDVAIGGTNFMLTLGAGDCAGHAIAGAEPLICPLSKSSKHCR